jgi:ribosomal protein L11 methyltransferase
VNWIEVTAFFESAPEDWSIYIEIFRDHGCENTIQTDTPPSLGAAVVDVEGSGSVVESLANDLKSAGATEVRTRPLVEENWDEVWRQFFKPRRIGERFVIRPTWESYTILPDDLEIVLDPGQAFGTGDHPTTRMCLELLEGARVAGQRIADVGCGSGILSIAAKKLGAEEVNGVDIEALSVEVARENAKLNGSNVNFVVGDSVASLPPGPYALLVSNIISATLIAMAYDFADSLTPDGEWIASGIIEQNWADVRAAAERATFHVIDEKREDGWVAARFQLIQAG